MSTDLAVPALVAAGRRPGLVVARMTAVKAVRSALVWGCVCGLYIASSALAYASTYTTTREREALAATFGANAGFNALIGPAHLIGTVGGFTAWRSLGVLGIVGGVWGLLTATRLLRGEEEAGRWELLLAGQTTRRAATAQAVAGLAAGWLTLWGVTAGISVAVGRAGGVGIGVGPALFLALAVAASAAVFLAVGALAGQLAPTRRQAAGFAAAVLGVSFALRMIADSGTGLDRLRWFTPLGWAEELRPLTAPRPLLLVPLGALLLVTAGLAIHLAGSRDVGASLIPDRPAARARTRLLSGPTGLAVRLTRGVAAGWVAATALGALLMGLIATSVGDALSATAGDREAFAKLGYSGSGVEQYLAVTFLLVALLTALVAAGQIGAVRGEEAGGRLEHLLVRPVSRYRWLGGRLAVATGYLVAAGLVAGLMTWVGVAGRGVGFGTLLGAGLNVVPPAVLVLGVGALTFGVAPRAVPAVTYGLVAWSFLVQILGSVVTLSAWVLDTSLFHQMAAAPAAPVDRTAGSVMVVLGVAAATAGAVAFRHRDLVGD